MLALYIPFSIHGPPTALARLLKSDAVMFVVWSTGRLRSNGGASRSHGARRVDGHLKRRDHSVGRVGRDQTDLALRCPAAVQEGLRRHPRQGRISYSSACNTYDCTAAASIPKTYFLSTSSEYDRRVRSVRAR